jgi:hypothetical protein
VTFHGVWFSYNIVIENVSLVGFLRMRNKTNDA